MKTMKTKMLSLLAVNLAVWQFTASAQQ